MRLIKLIFNAIKRAFKALFGPKSQQEKYFDAVEKDAYDHNEMDL